MLPFMLSKRLEEDILYPIDFSSDVNVFNIQNVSVRVLDENKNDVTTDIIDDSYTAWDGELAQIMVTGGVPGSQYFVSVLARMVDGETIQFPGWLNILHSWTDTLKDLQALFGTETELSAILSVQS